MRYTVSGADGRPIDAHFEIRGSSLVYFSRGGRKGANARNTDYSEGLKLLLQRITIAKFELLGVWVDSSRVQDLPLEERRIYGPEDQRVAPAEAFRRIAARMQRVGRSPDAKSVGGNATKRIRLQFSDDLAEKLIATIVGGIPVDRASQGTTSEVDQIGENLNIAGEFDPANDKDARRRILAALVRRRGQPAFRRSLMEAYDRRCAITGCDVEAALEAAHIMPYRGDHTNFVSNGLLLRSDIHALFDLGLLGVEPTTMRVVVHDALRASAYRELEGQEIRKTRFRELAPSAEALASHLVNAGLTR